jgi:hypothetical protein
MKSTASIFEFGVAVLSGRSGQLVRPADRPMLASTSHFGFWLQTDRRAVADSSEPIRFGAKLSLPIRLPKNVG